jgi:RimJ/RimL family protein N-acetyltransferase
MAMPEVEPMIVEPVTLEGDVVRLEPLADRHLPALAEVGFEPAIWRWTLARITNAAELAAWAGTAMRAADAGTELPFATVERASGRAIGSTRFLNIERQHHRVEVGWTWVAPAWQRTAVNSEAKLLMLEHAFERLGCNRVEFKTDALNERSRTAMLGIGCVFEGIFRQHMVMPGGRLRDTAWYSIVAPEWPDVKAHILERLARHGKAAATSA